MLVEWSDMPPKIRDLERQLKRAGFVLQKDRGQGSHRIYKHPKVPGSRITISGHSGNDARWYQEAEVKKVLALVEAYLGEFDE
jgi:predicted RNA binding protein YcfA (HicA-like mRNA interferase family)